MQQKGSTSSEKPLLDGNDKLASENASHFKYTIPLTRKLCIGQDRTYKSNLYILSKIEANLNPEKSVSIFLIVLFIRQSFLDGVPFLKLSKKMDFSLNRISLESQAAILLRKRSTQRVKIKAVLLWMKNRVDKVRNRGARTQKYRIMISDIKSGEPW